MPREKLLFPEMEKVTLSIRMPVSLVDELDKDAEVYDVTRNQVIVAIVEKYYRDDA